MARVLVVSDRDPALHVKLVEDDDGHWDGPCSDPACDYTVSYGGERFYDLTAAVRDADVHLDHQH